MRSQRGLPLVAAVLLVLGVSACGSSGASSTSTGSSSSSTTSTSSPSSSTTSTSSPSSTPTSSGAVDSSAMRSLLEQEILSTAGVKAPEAKEIVDCIIAKLSAAGITTDGEAASHEGELTNFSEACAEKVVAAGG